MKSHLTDINAAEPAQQEIERVERHVHRRVARRVRDFRLQFEARGLILRGFAVSFYAKQLAQHAVMEATSLPIAANAIEVIHGTRSHVDEFTIREPDSEPLACAD